MKLNIVVAGMFALVISLFGTITLAQQDVSRDDLEIQRVEPFQVFDNLYYVGAQWVSAWVLETDQGLILFDSLYGDLVDIAIDGIRELGMDPDDIRYVVVSHAHYDHIGGARRMQQEFGATVLMTQEDWDMAASAPAQAYPKPIQHLVVNNGSTLTLGRTNLAFFHTPGHSPGVLSTRFTVYDNGYPRVAFMFGGAGLNFNGVERTQMYIDSVKRLMTMTDIEVNVSNHPGSGNIFDRNIQLIQRRASQPHPFVDPDGFKAWLDELLINAEAKLEEERAAVN